MDLATTNVLTEVVEAGIAFRGTAIVDDDFPHVRNTFDKALTRAKDFLKNNEQERRKMQEAINLQAHQTPFVVMPSREHTEDQSAQLDPKEWLKITNGPKPFGANSIEWGAGATVTVGGLPPRPPLQKIYHKVRLVLGDASIVDVFNSEGAHQDIMPAYAAFLDRITKLALSRDGNDSTKVCMGHEPHKPHNDGCAICAHTQLLQEIKVLLKEGVTFMSKISEFASSMNDAMSGVADDVTAIASDAGTIATGVGQVVDALNKINTNPGPISPEDQALLDGALVKGQSLKTAADTLKASADTAAQSVTDAATLAGNVANGGTPPATTTPGTSGGGTTTPGTPIVP